MTLQKDAHLYIIKYTLFLPKVFRHRWDTYLYVHQMYTTFIAGLEMAGTLQMECRFMYRHLLGKKVTF